MKLLGEFTATAYGPPWDSMNGTGVTKGGTDLRPTKKAFIVAVDPSEIPLGTKLIVQPNPHGNQGTYLADDIGGAIDGRHIDIYDWRGRDAQLGWGTRKVRVWDAGKGDDPQVRGGPLGATPEPVAAGGAVGAVDTPERRSQLLTGLLWVLLVLGGAGLFIVGAATLAGAGPSGGGGE